MNLREIQAINAHRAVKWHKGGLNEWTLLEWTGALCGEAGEAANVAKKIRRLQLGLPNKEAGLDVLKIKLGKEVCDTIIYGLIILSALGQDAEILMAEVFNQKSIEYGFPDRLND